MKIPFACPSCGATGLVDAASVGKPARCKHCGHRFNIPGPGAAEPEVFSLVEPVEEAAGDGYALGSPTVRASAFTPSRGDEPAADAPRRPRRSTSSSKSRAGRRRAAGTAWVKRLAWIGGTAAIIIVAVALLAPNGVIIAACALMAIGSGMILLGYGVGAYGAFSEDFLYGFLYVVFPFYAAYYMVTRWDDLWVWFTCMTSGVGLAALGIEMARWGGMGA
jgi:hypothetical protein